MTYFNICNGIQGSSVYPSGTPKSGLIPVLLACKCLILETHPAADKAIAADMEFDAVSREKDPQSGVDFLFTVWHHRPRIASPLWRAEVQFGRVSDRNWHLVVGCSVRLLGYARPRHRAKLQN
jgi:hypothetical protein